MFSDYIIYILLAGIYVWLFIRERREQQSQEPINLNVNVSTGGDPAPGKQTTGKQENITVSKTSNRGEVPIEAPDRSKSWKNVEVDDAFNG